MTVGLARRRVNTGGGSRNRSHHVAKFSPVISTTIVIFAALCFQSERLCCEANDAESGNSHPIKKAEEMVPIYDAEASPGVRGAFQADDSGLLQSDLDVSSSSVMCNIQCCSSFFDLMAETDRDHLLEYDGLRKKGSHTRTTNSAMRVRMLQESSNTTLPSNTTAPNPCPAEETGDGVGLPMPVQYLLIVVLILFSALFSGLTLGLMSLDPSGLEIVMANTEDPKMARAAKHIYPVRLNGNLLLCTLLLGNVGVNSMLSILMADLTSGLVGFIVSTAVIVVFGEIIPQALCSRFALQIGEKTIPLVKVIMVLLYPLCKPLSMILNKVLGHEIGTTYSTSEMAKLIEMHAQTGTLEGATAAAMTGALRYRSVPVSEAMTPVDNTFMLSADERLGFDTVAKIFKTGYSRVPVYEVSQSNIIGLLFVKDLIFLDPEDEIPVKNFVQIFGRGLHVVWPDMLLGDVLKLLKRGKSHMALVRDVNDGGGKVDPFYEIKGIITLEDIIEIILGDEIVDETDELVDVNDPNSHVQRSVIGGDYIGQSTEDTDRSETPIVGGGVSDGSSSRTSDWETRLRLLDERLVDEHLSRDEVAAVSAHLKTNHSKSVELISDKQLKELLSLVPVTEITPATTCATGECSDDGGVPSDSAELIYERGVATDFCTVVLSGKIMVMSGADRFRSDVSNWGVLASRALTDPSYVPDFSAWVLPNQNSSGGCRCIKLTRKSYGDAVDNTAWEKTDHNVDSVPSAVTTLTITEESSSPPGGATGEGSSIQRRKRDTLQLPLVPENSAVKPSVQGTIAISLPPQTLNDSRAGHTHQASARHDAQQRRYSRRSQMLKAFNRSLSKKKNASQD